MRRERMSKGVLVVLVVMLVVVAASITPNGRKISTRAVFHVVVGISKPLFSL